MSYKHVRKGRFDLPPILPPGKPTHTSNSKDEEFYWKAISNMATLSELTKEQAKTKAKLLASKVLSVVLFVLILCIVWRIPPF